MYMKEIKESIKNKIFKSCYVFYGPEVFLKRNYEEQLKKAVLGSLDDMMNLEIFDDKKIMPDTIINASETFPFLAEKRLIIVRDSGLFHTGRKNESEKMSDYISKIPETACIVFIEDEVDKRGKLYKSVSKNGHAVEFKTPPESDIIKWIMTGFKKNKVVISNDTAAYLLRTVGSSMENALGEIEKLTAYKNGEGEITKSDIDSVCIKSFETKIFDLVAAIGNKKAETALEIYRNMLMMKESPIMILAMITRQFRIIFQCSELLKSGENNAGIAARLGQREFVVRECVKQSKNFSGNILMKAIEYCLETDINIKTGKMNGDLAVEVLIIKYSGAVA